MDRPLADSVLKKRRWRRAVVILAGAALVFLILSALTGWLRPSVRRSRIRTATVERGLMEETLTASGTVIPAYEHVLTSPIDTRVLRIHLTPGATVTPGQPILDLDVGTTQLALEKIDDQIALKGNERERAHLNHAATIGDLESQRGIKELELQSLEYEADRCRQYFEMGLFSADEVRKAETDAERCRIELAQFARTLANTESTLAVQLRGLDLEFDILAKERSEVKHSLDLATTVSDRQGILTWVVPSEGTAVRRGDELARIADLSAYRVEATISDVHAARIAIGLPVIVRSGQLQLRGRIDRVRPTVERGIVTFEAALDQPSHPDLRHNLRVDAYVVTEHHADALRVKRGPYLRSDGTHAVFVIRGDAAARTPVRLGLTNFDYYEILEGLDEGDEVIISDMGDYQHWQGVKLR